MSREQPWRRVRLAGMLGTIHGLGHRAHGGMQEVRIEWNHRGQVPFPLAARAQSHTRHSRIGGNLPGLDADDIAISGHSRVGGNLPLRD